MIDKDDFTEKMLAAIHRFNMVDCGQKLLVGVSGGPDSVALLHALKMLSDKLQIELLAAHLNHSFRGEESDADAEYVRELSRSLGIDVIVEKIDVPEMKKVLRISDEEAARLIRYDFYERTAAKVGAQRIALGHTADDQVETVMHNLIRGTGIDGISGIPPVRDNIIRPLIQIRRKSVEEYIRQHNLHPRTDITNLQPAYTRNRIRLELLPSIRSQYNSNIDEAILRLSELAREDSAYLNIAADEGLRNIIRNESPDCIVIDAGGLLRFPLAIIRRIVRSVIKKVRGELADIGYTHIDELINLIYRGSNFEYDLPGGTHFSRSYDDISISKKQSLILPVEYCRDLIVPGVTPVPEIDANIEAVIYNEYVNPVREIGSLEIIADFGRIKGKLKVQNWQPGDRIRPLGLNGTKKIQDIFTDKKVPKQARHRVPVISDDEKIIWVSGMAISENIKISEDTKVFLLLKIL